jgi:anti-sigma B factor antagonist
VTAGLALTTRGHGGRIVVALRGELDIAVAASTAVALAALAAPGGEIIIDLAGLEFIDCRGLAALAGVRSQARRAGGDVLLAAPQPQVHRILAATGLIHVFSVHASVADVAGHWGQVLELAGPRRGRPGQDGPRPRHARNVFSLNS